MTAGTTATLVCDVRASPSATAVFWNKDGAPIDRTSGRYSGGTVASPSLVISTVAKGDTGYYTCVGTNGIGSTTGDRIYLLVRCESRGLPLLSLSLSVCLCLCVCLYMYLRVQREREREREGSGWQACCV